MIHRVAAVANPFADIRNSISVMGEGPVALWETCMFWDPDWGY